MSETLSHQPDSNTLRTVAEGLLQLADKIDQRSADPLPAELLTPVLDRGLLSLIADQLVSQANASFVLRVSPQRVHQLREHKIIVPAMIVDGRGIGRDVVLFGRHELESQRNTRSSYSDGGRGPYTSWK